MKIAHVNAAFQGLHRRFGGAEAALYRTATIIREQGHEPFLITFRPDVDNPECDFPFYTVRRCEDYLPSFVARYLEPVKWYAWQNDPLAAKDFRNIMRREKPDIVHFHNIPFFGLELIRIAAEMGAKTCYSVYDYWIFCPNVMLLDWREQYCRRFHGVHCVECLPRFLRSIQKILLARRKQIFDSYMQFIDRWIVLSGHSAGVLDDYGIPRRKIKLVRLSSPFEFAESHAGDLGATDRHRIFFAGWLQQKKGVHILLEAMPLIKKQCPEAKLRVAGHKTKFDWDYKKKLETLMQRPGMKECVTFLGHLTSAQIEIELRQATVIAVPEQYENMSPVIMIEAMAMKKPVVASRAGGIPEYIEDGVTGWLADPRSPRDFADKIVAVLQGKVDAVSAGKKARARILDICSKEKITAATMEAYNFSSQ